MAVNIRPLRASSNIEILNAIRSQASNEYQRRIPSATKANIADTIQTMWDYRPARNEFVNALVNQIGMIIARNVSWSNPLAKFKMGMLNYGQTIEEYQVGLIEATTYDPSRDSLERDVFGQAVIDVQSSFHKVNRQDKYKITINDNTLKQAFTSDNGLSTFISQLLEAPTTSDQWDEFLLTAGLFKEYHRNGGFFKVNVPDVSAQGSTEANAKYFLRRVRELSSTLPFISTHYNAAGMPVAAKPDDLELFITPEALAAIDVEALAGAFNIERADVSSRMTVIPAEHFGIKGAQAILTTRDFFVIADQLLETRSMQNPDGLYENHWLHHWQVISASRFVPAVLFTSVEASTVINIVDTPVTDVTALVIKDQTGAVVTTVDRGYQYNVDGTAITNPTGGVNDAVILTLTGAKSSYTYLTQTGTLSVGPDEDAGALTITSTAQSDLTVSKSTTVNVEGAKVEVWPNPQVLEDADSDGLLEVTPEAVPVAPTSGADKNKVKIPNTQGVEYRDGATPVNGQTLTLTANKTITAVAKAGYELKAGATASWNLVYTA